MNEVPTPGVQEIPTDQPRWSSPGRISPVWQFCLFIVPVTMNGFFLVYALTGYVLEGRNKRNWSLEAGTVGLWVGGGMVLYCLLVLLFVRLKGHDLRHMLGLSSLVHIVIAIGLTASILLNL